MINNERGSALALVLLMIVIFSILGVSLLAMNLTATKQFNQKEEQVQARHLAEMGVLHYKAKVEEAVDEYHKKEFECVYITLNKVVIIDEDASLRKYYKELCDAVTEVTVDPYVSDNGKYSLNRDEPACHIGSSEEIPAEMVLSVESTGEVTEAKKTIIDAQVTISSGNSEGNGTSGDSNSQGSSGSIPKKPQYPEADWSSKSAVGNLDEIKDLSSVKVVQGSTNQKPFRTASFVEIIGSVDMPKDSHWTFKNHLIVEGNFKTNTGGKEDSTIIVNKDFFISGALQHLSNHTKSNVDGDFIVKEDATFGTKSRLSVKGNALFGEGISLVDTHAQIIIYQNAYFKKPLGSVENKANVCVSGDIFLWKDNAWAPYLSTYPGYQGFEKSCLGTYSGVSGEQYNWAVQPELNAEYR